MRVRGDERQKYESGFARHAMGPMWHVARDGRARACNRLAEAKGLEEVSRLAAQGEFSSGYDVWPVPMALGGGVMVALPMPSFLERVLLLAGAEWKLTARELDVLRVLCDGWETTEAAERLGITWNTLRVHHAALLKKSGCASLKELLTMLLRMG